MKVPLLNIDGTKTSSIEITDKLVNLKVNHKLITYVIDWQINHSKKRVAKTKQRNEVIGSTKKIYAQKGTGGARHASRKAPIFVGGGVAHGPKGANYKVKKINKKMRKLALAQTISKKRSNKELYVFDDVKKQVKKLVEKQSNFPDWNNRADIKSALKVDLILLLDEFGYPPVDRDEVYHEIFEQAENFKKNQPLHI